MDTPPAQVYDSTHAYNLEKQARRQEFEKFKLKAMIDFQTAKLQMCFAEIARGGVEAHTELFKAVMEQMNEFTVSLPSDTDY